MVDVCWLVSCLIAVCGARVAGLIVQTEKRQESINFCSAVKSMKKTHFDSPMTGTYSPG